MQNSSTQQRHSLIVISIKLINAIRLQVNPLIGTKCVVWYCSNYKICLNLEHVSLILLM